MTRNLAVSSVPVGAIATVVVLLSGCGPTNVTDKGRSGASPAAPASPADPTSSSSTETAVSPTAPPSPEFEQWRRTMSDAPLPKNGCFRVSHPGRTWEEVPCTVPPNRPYSPSPHAPLTVGGAGLNIAASVADLTDPGQAGNSTITATEGKIDVLAGSFSISSYSLQLNTNRFDTELCNGRAGCQGWQQFVYSTYENSAFIQYWLIKYGSGCPANWKELSGDCWINNDIAVEVPRPSNLGLAVLTGKSAASTGAVDQDRVTMLSNGTLYTTSTAGRFKLDTGRRWHLTDFNIYGDCCGAGVNFPAGVTLRIRTSITNDHYFANATTNPTAATAAPHCSPVQLTGETNNLTVVPNSCCSFAALGTPPSATWPGVTFIQSNPPTSAVPFCLLSDLNGFQAAVLN